MIINNVKVELKEIDEITCSGCVFDNCGTCTCTADERYCSLHTIYVKSKE